MTHSKEDDITFMSNPDNWPHSFFLPLKKGNDCGFLYQPSIVLPTPPPRPVIYLANMFGLKSDWHNKTNSIHYKSFEAILDDGWWID